jgi:Zn-dependent metalloprotease
MATLLDVRTGSGLLDKVNGAFAAAATAGLVEDSNAGLDMLATAMGLSAGESLSLEAVPQEDDLGLSHTRYRQRIGGVPVWGSQVSITRSSDGNVRRMHGVVAQGVAVEVPDVEPAYSPQEAVEHVKEILRGESDLGEATEFSGEDSELVVYLSASGSPRLCYDVWMGSDLKQGGGKPTSPRFLLDAKTRATVLHFDELATLITSSSDTGSSSGIPGQAGDREIANGTPGKGTGPGGNLKTNRYQYGTDLPAFDVTLEGQDYIMETAQVRTINLNHGEAKKTGAYRYKGPENTYKEINGAFCPLNDAHCFGLVVFAMYKDWFNTSPLGASQLILGVHYQNQYENAFWSPSDRMMGFGDGRNRMYPLVSLDVLAHEVSHGFTTDHSNLFYREESGGINEAFSDMAGEAAEFYLRQTNDSLVGATIMKKEGSALRYMDDPPKDGRSIGSASDYYPELDMHYSSGVYNKAFYILATTSGWDTKKAFEIFVRANMRYWGPSTNFVQGARGVVDAADDLGYPTQDVIAAFAKVDIAV